MSLNESKLKEYIKTNTNIGSIKITSDTSLFESGLLDSIQLLGLIEYIESEADIQIKNSDITIENIDSIKRILNFVSESIIEN